MESLPPGNRMEYKDLWHFTRVGTDLARTSKCGEAEGPEAHGRPGRPLPQHGRFPFNRRPWTLERRFPMLPVLRTNTALSPASTWPMNRLDSLFEQFFG